MVEPLPFAFITKRSLPRTNASLDPSGDHAGSLSLEATACGSTVTCRAPLPSAAFTVQMP